MARPALISLVLLSAIAGTSPHLLDLGSAPPAPAELLVVLNKRVASASLIDLATGQTVATVPTGVGPHEVAISPDSRLAVVSNYGEQTPGNSLTVIDLRERRPVRTIDLGEFRRPHGIAWLPGTSRVAVTSEVTQSVVVVDVAAGAIAGVIATGEQGTHLLALSPDGRYAYTANIMSGTISRIDLTRQALVKTVAAAPESEAIDLSPDGRELWVGSNSAHRLKIFDAATLDTVASVPSGGEVPIRVKFTPDGKQVLVSHVGTGDVRLFDRATRAPVATIPIEGGRPIGILMDPSGGRAWVAASGRDEIAEVDLRAHKVTRFLKTGTNPDGLGYARLEQ